MTYTNEQIEEAAKTYEGYGEPVVPAMLRAWIAERKKMVVTEEMVAEACFAYDELTELKPDRATPWAMRSAIETALKEMQK